MAQVPCFLTLFATLRNGAASGCQTVTADCPFVVFLEHPVLPVKRTVRYIGKYPAHFLFRALGDNDPVVDLLGAQSGIFADAGIIDFPFGGSRIIHTDRGAVFRIWHI